MEWKWVFKIKWFSWIGVKSISESMWKLWGEIMMMKSESIWKKFTEWIENDGPEKNSDSLIVDWFLIQMCKLALLQFQKYLLNFNRKHTDSFCLTNQKGTQNHWSQQSSPKPHGALSGKSPPKHSVSSDGQGNWSTLSFQHSGSDRLHVNLALASFQHWESPSSHDNFEANQSFQQSSSRKLQSWSVFYQGF